MALKREKKLKSKYILKRSTYLIIAVISTTTNMELSSASNSIRAKLSNHLLKDSLHHQLDPLIQTHSVVTLWVEGLEHGLVVLLPLGHINLKQSLKHDKFQITTTNFKKHQPYLDDPWPASLESPAPYQAWQRSHSW